MNSIKKKKIFFDLKKIINEKNFIDDIWIYGNLSDTISDIDLIIVYKADPKKILFPKYIQDLIADGSVIYINKKSKNKIFLFDDIKTFSVKNNKNYKPIINKSYKRFRSLTSFIERYYERKTILEDKKIYNVNNINIRNLKTIFFSYENFYKYSHDKFIKKKYDYLFKKYFIIRNKYESRDLKVLTYRNFIKDIKYFDNFFFVKSFHLLQKKFNKNRKLNFKYNFKKKICYSNKKSKNTSLVPSIVFYLFYFYACQRYKISKLILKDMKFDKKDFKFPFSRKFQIFLKKKISFINDNFLILKKKKFSSGLYRFSWYLNY